MVRELPGAGFFGRARGHRAAAFVAEYRFPRGGPPGHHGRPRLARRPLLEEGTNPAKGLAVARMAAHITYLSDEALHRKFGRNLQNRDKVTFAFDADFQVESYLRYQGISFVDRFDANSYLYITRAMDYFDLAADTTACWRSASAARKTRFCVVSFTSDWLFPTRESRAIVQALNAVAANVSFVEIESDKRARRLPAATSRRCSRDPRIFERGGATARPARGSARRQPMTALKESVPTFKERAKAELAATPRIDLLVIAGLVEQGARVLDVGCGKGELLKLLEEQKQVDGRGIELKQSRVNFCVGRGLSVIQGDADHDLADLSRPGFRLRDPEPHAAGDVPAEGGAGGAAAHRPACDRLVPEFRLLAHPAANPVRRAHARDVELAGGLVRDAEHPFLYHSRFPRALRSGRRAGGALLRAVALWAPARHEGAAAAA